jgi:hypothetical protein
MPKKKKATSTRQVGDSVVVPLHNGRIVEAVIKARIEKSDGVRLQVSFGHQTALIHIALRLRVKPTPPFPVRCLASRSG